MSFTYPKIHLVMDNCFAIKRWVKPKDWMEIIREIGGISKIQASTDNEIDPLFCTKDYRDNWVQEVQEYGAKYNMEVVSFYSGYATYRTVGIAGSHQGSRDKVRTDYFNNVVDVASKIGAQVGNTLSAFSIPVLSSPEEFDQHNKYLKDSLVKMAEYAKQKNVFFSYEQMYSPIQGFWRIEDCKDWIKAVYEQAGCPMYITIDTAHQAGQKHFRKQSPVAGHIYLPDGFSSMPQQEQDKYAYLFSEEKDSDLYAWFEELGAYSPLVHLQQTDGTYSKHKPFTTDYNRTGIVKPKDVFQAIAKSYAQPEIPGMPPKVENIYLAFEIFYGVTDSTEKIIKELKESVSYWRDSLPRDGMTLDELI